MQYKSIEIYKQKGPTYIDIAVGSIPIKNDDYLVFKRKRPSNKEKLTAYGYKNMKDNGLHELSENTANLEKVELKPEKVNKTHDIALISDVRRDYELSREKVNRSRFFNNCITLDKRLFSGGSGCPIVDSDGYVRGVLIGSSQIVKSSDMILSKYCTKYIRYHTSIMFDMYQDINS